jgi:hypothetical protein
MPEIVALPVSVVSYTRPFVSTANGSTEGAMAQHESDNTLLAEVSSHEETGKRSRRWSEIRIYRRSDGVYEAEELGRSTVAGEVDRERRTVCRDAQGVYDALLINGRLTALATDALEQASQSDPVFATSLGDRHEVEDLDALPAGASALPAMASDQRAFVLERDGDRALRFVGRQIGHGTSEDPSVDTWLEVCVFATSSGRFVVQKAQVARGEREPRRSAVHVVDDADGALRALVRTGTGWIETPVVDALREAARKDDRFARSLGSRLENLRQLVSDVPHVGPALREILRVLERGQFIVEDLDEEGQSAGVRWEPQSSGLPAIPRALFIVLSRRRLIRLTSKTARSQTWTISTLGGTALHRGAEGQD